MCRSSLYIYIKFPPDITIPVDWALKKKLLTCVSFFIADFTRTLGSNVDSLRTNFFANDEHSIFILKEFVVQFCIEFDTLMNRIKPFSYM